MKYTQWLSKAKKVQQESTGAYEKPRLFGNNQRLSFKEKEKLRQLSSGQHDSILDPWETC